jgi:Raf kinase inhibitor-like YbhB/YbcL family protein
MLLKVVAVSLTPLGWLMRNRRAGDEHSVRRAPELAAPRTIDVSSPAFTHGGRIPDRHTALDLGPNVSPELRWRGVPAGTKQLLLVIEDIDVPFSRPSLHTVAVLTPDETGVAEGELTAGNPRYRYMPTRGGRTGYFGPRPFPGHGQHRYGFHLYALDEELPAQPPRDLAQLLTLVRGHVLADGFLEGVRRG